MLQKGHQVDCVGDPVHRLLFKKHHSFKRFVRTTVATSHN